MTIVRAAGMELTDGDITRAATRFGIDGVEPLGGFENAVYRSTAPTGRILRLTHPSRRSVEMVRAEFAFMDHLARSGVPVVAPVYSRADEAVEELVTEAGERLVIACMTEAAGSARHVNHWSDSDLEAYGALLGRMHAAAASYRPPVGAPRRPSWTHPMFDVGLGDCASTHPQLFRRRQEMREAAAANTAGSDEFVIHKDAHPGNLFLTDTGECTLFDFDDCAHGSAAHDIAIVLFHWMTERDADPGTEAKRFSTKLSIGYERHARLPANWPSVADLFLSHRELDTYWLIAMDPVETHSERDRRFMRGRRERILEGTPFLGIPLAEII